MKLWCDSKREAPPGWDWARTIEDAKAQLSTGKIVLASVGYRLVDGKIIDLLEWLDENRQFRPAHWIEVHDPHRDVANRLKKCVRLLYGRRR